MSTMGPAHLEQLYAEELSLSSASSGFKGRFSWRPVADARDTAGAMLLSSPDQRAMVGLLWITVDPDCTLQYEVSVVVRFGLALSPGVQVRGGGVRRDYFIVSRSFSRFILSVKKKKCFSNFGKFKTLHTDKTSDF